MPLLNRHEGSEFPLRALTFVALLLCSLRPRGDLSQFSPAGRVVQNYAFRDER